MAKPISIQLYTVRETLVKDYESVIRKIAGIGYIGVEPYDFRGIDPQDFADLCQSLGLQIPSAHSPLPLGDKREEVLRRMKLYGCKYLVCPSIPAEELRTVEGTIGGCKRMNEANKIAQANGLILAYHNHELEFQQIAGSGTYAYKIMNERLDPSIGLQIDTYWAKVGGCDPVAVLKELGERVPLLHIKDGPADSKEAPMTAVGSGKMDVPAIIEAGKFAKWIIVELDRCATDMMTAVEESYRYLVGKGLARGNKN